MDLDRLCTSRVVIVAGKGGVGKTTTAAALALAAARSGRSVLAVEIEGKSGLAAMFGHDDLNYQDREIAPGIRARTLTPDDALVEYLDDHALARLSRRLVRNGATDMIATAIPGMKDILVLGKVKQLERHDPADLIVVDAPAAGHAVTLLMSPIGLHDAVRAGPIHAQAQDVIELLTDGDRSQVMLVTLPEETPVNELIDTAFALEDRVGVKLAPVVVNGCLGTSPAPAPPDQLADIAGAAGITLTPSDIGALVAAARFRAARVVGERAQIERLTARLPLPHIELPFLFTAEIRADDVAALADALARPDETS